MTAASALDVRLHTPIPDVVLIRVSGPVDQGSSPDLARLVDRQLGRAPHVVLDLRDVSFLGPLFLQLLHTVHARAHAVGTELHVSAEHHEVRRALRSSGLDQLVRMCTAVEMVVAGLRRGPDR